MVIALLALVAVNIAFSPSWKYLDRVLSAVQVPQEYDEIAAGGEN
jgi:hypothetical protein